MSKAQSKDPDKAQKQAQKKAQADDRCRACLQAEIDIEQLEQELATTREQLSAATARLRQYEPEPGRCEHDVAEGDWCEPCNLAYKAARTESGECDG